MINITNLTRLISENIRMQLKTLEAYYPIKLQPPMPQPQLTLHISSEHSLHITIFIISSTYNTMLILTFPLLCHFPEKI